MIAAYIRVISGLFEAGAWLVAAFILGYVVGRTARRVKS